MEVTILSELYVDIIVNNTSNKKTLRKKLITINNAGDV